MAENRPIRLIDYDIDMGVKTADKADEIFYEIFRKLLSETVVELQLLEAESHEEGFKISCDPDHYPLHQMSFIAGFLGDMRKASQETIDKMESDEAKKDNFIPISKGDSNG